MELCVGFTSDEWRDELRPKLESNDRDAWEEAIGVSERRLKERFLRCIEALLKLDQTESRGSSCAQVLV